MLWCAAWFRQFLLFSREEKKNEEIWGKFIISADSPACLQLITYIVALAVHKEGSLWFKDLFIVDGSCVENSRSYPKSCLVVLRLMYDCFLKRCFFFQLLGWCTEQKAAAAAGLCFYSCLHRVGAGFWCPAPTSPPVD